MTEQELLTKLSKTGTFWLIRVRQPVSYKNPMPDLQPVTAKNRSRFRKTGELTLITKTEPKDSIIITANDLPHLELVPYSGEKDARILYNNLLLQWKYSATSSIRTTDELLDFCTENLNTDHPEVIKSVINTCRKHIREDA